MSMLVCHAQKMKSSDVRGMQIHNQRESENSSNQDIDRNLTAQNYDLVNDEPINYQKKVKEILKDGYKVDKAIRKDATVLVSVLVSSDKEFFDKLNQEEQKQFFQKATDYLSDRFGKQNTVCATVHLDEKTPHMHFQFVPLTEDGNLSAKKLLDRVGLRKLQDELPKALQQSGFQISRGESAEGKNKHKKTNDWKAEQLQKREQELAAQEQSLKQQEGIIEQAKQKAVNEKELVDVCKRAKVKNPLFGDKHVELSVSDYNKLAGTAITGSKAIAEIEPLREKAAAATSLQEKNRSLENINRNLSKENKALNENVSGLTQKLNRVASRTYRRYSDKGLSDKQAAAVMLKVDQLGERPVTKAIAAGSSSAPSKSSEADSFAKKIVAAAANMSSKDVAIAAKLTGEDKDIDWGALTADQVQEQQKQIEYSQSI